MLTEVVDALQLQPKQVVVDGTIGGGGHAREILRRISPGGTLIGFDRDQNAIDHVQATLGKDFSTEQLHLIHDNFLHITQHAKRLSSLGNIHAILLDLGISNSQIRDEGRGFSFKEVDAPLDMRMDVRQEKTAQYLVNSLPLEQLITILRNYGEEPNARRIAKAIVEQREQIPLTTVGDLLECAYRGYSGRSKPRSHLATRTFQAFRIAVNEELDLLKPALEEMIDILAIGGRLAVITFHSLEDRIVKQVFKKASIDCICPSELPECRCEHKASVKRISKKPIIPTAEEIEQNPQSRSSKLRIIEKI